MRLLLLTLYALLGAVRTKHATTRCTDNACFTFHKDNKTFELASQDCVENGGYLITIRNAVELNDVKSIVSLKRKLPYEEKIWIGLKLEKGKCMINDESLHGFKWISGNTDSAYSNWNKKPSSTCTEERCVSIYSEELKWRDGSCKDSAFYMCKFIINGMCKPPLLWGLGEVNYTLPFSKLIKQDEGFTMLPFGTFAEISCADTGERLHTVCKDTDTGFVWEKPGPFCISGKRSCRNNNGGCDHLCSENDGTGVGCECKEGYYLGDDKVTCILRDNCHNNPCESVCVSNSTGFSCRCKDGFQLAEDQTSCVDVDECRQNVCGGQICHNDQGTYKCECKKGFKDVGGKCEDIDECSESTCKPNAECLNSEGSFTCFCPRGFRDSDNGEKCTDVDECLNSPCTDKCTNTIGSYTCSCGANHRLADDGISCIPDQNQIFPISTSKEPFDSTTVAARLTEEAANERNSVHKDSSQRTFLVWVCVLGTVIPLLLLIVLTFVISLHRWHRSREDARKKNTTADGYCWVSSGVSLQTESEHN
ncbi:complement component C1q receptor [Electrophorus electricus]|uniref:Complement component C1q receptor n=1 Tax=Electrophorus electricus TaxID=8005 RepID=A0A4W4HGH4_ELEEL|nr:complement component C1q receptor [Electrophorus electricus]